MADLERATRITDLRERRGLTQPQVVAEVEALAERDGWPIKQGKTHRVVSLRGYQTWENTGGIKRENSDLLAQLYGEDPDWLWRGDTPDLIGQMNGDRPELETLADQIISEMKAALLPLTRRLNHIEQRLAAIDEKLEDVDESRAAVDRSLRDLERVLQAATGSSRAAGKRTPTKAKSREGGPRPRS